MFTVAGSPHRHRPAARRSARRQGPRVVLAARTGTGCSSRPIASRRSTGSSPACRTRARCSTSSPPGGSSRPRDIVANHVVSVPDPNVLIARSAVPLTVEVVVRGYITGVTDTALWTQYAAGARVMYGHELPDGLTKNSRLARRSSPRPPRPSTGLTTCRCRAPMSPTVAWSIRSCGNACRPSRWPCSNAARASGEHERTDPGRHEVRVRAHHRRRAAAHRRGAHAGLVTVVGRLDLRRTGRRGRRAREPRQGGRAAGARRHRLHRRRARPRIVPRRLVGHHRPLHRRLRTTDRRLDFVPGSYPAGPRIHRRARWTGDLPS